MEVEEKAVIGEIKSGKSTRFSYLTEKYGKMCVHFFLLRCRCSLDIAMDLAQESFIRVFKSIHGFDLERSFKPWLMAICRNVSADYMKAERMRMENIKRWIPPFEIALEHKVLKAVEIQEAIGRLPDRQAEIVIMHYFWDLSCVEIGALLDIHDGTVKCHLHKARGGLLEILLEKKE